MTAPLPFALDVAGYCTHPGRVTRPDASWRPLRFPALFGVIEHPRTGIVLVDTGYAPRFMAATARWPEMGYRLLTPVTMPSGETAVDRLAARGIRADDVRTIVVTHFHGDHIAGLRDFPRARIVFTASAWAAVADLRGLAAVRKAYLPALLPDDFSSRADALDDVRALRPLPPEVAPFGRGIDILGDATLWGVPLPGHAAGQLGVYFEAASVGPTLIAADAAWHSRSIRAPHDLHLLARLLSPDHRAWRATLDALHVLATGDAVRVVPLHCAEVAAGVGWMAPGPSSPDSSRWSLLPRRGRRGPLPPTPSPKSGGGGGC
jgi:glyoxylase-like metal-dependent hydrolase (beta-lactamase superfamily II)